MEEREIRRKSVVNRLIVKDMLYAVVAKYCLGNIEYEEEFLLMCYDSCNSDSFQKLCGTELLDDIIAYNVKYNGKSETIEPFILKQGDKEYVFQYIKKRNDE